MGLRVAELETLFTGDVSPFEKAAAQVEARQKQLDAKKTTLTVDTDAQSALSTLDKISSEARALPDGTITVDADTDAARRSLDQLETDSAAAGKTAGDGAGAGMTAGIIGALATIPIAGAVVGVGAAVGKGLADAIRDGLGVEVRSDRFAAQTGLDPVTVGKIARAAGEAYADNWGESLEANLGLARSSVQAGLLNPTATKRDAQAIISTLAGVADVVEEDANAIARSAATLMKNGLAKTADDAFDIIVKGQQAGLNVSEEWLDTLDEYGTKFRDLGLTAPQAMGLIRQALEGGARGTDVAADALKEFQLIASDTESTAGEGFRLLGLNAADMTAQITAGGSNAAKGLGLVLDQLRAVEDPVARNAAAVALFGTKAEDLGDALFSMDLSNAVEQLGAVEGAAKTALSVLTDNTQNQVDTAFRNIEVAADGVKGALAGAFGEPLENLANFVTNNRAGVIQFLLDIANGAIDLGRSLVEGVAAGTEAVGEFTAGPLADMVDAIASILNGLDNIPGIDVGGPEKSMRDLAESMRGADDTTRELADNIRHRLLEEGLDPMQDKLNEVGDQLVWDAEVHDAQVRLASAIDSVNTSAGALDDQVLTVKDRMLEQAEAAHQAGESTDEMTTSLSESRDALINQLEAMGLTKKEAKALADQYGLIPTDIVTNVKLEGATGTYQYLQSIQALIRDITGDHRVRVATGGGAAGGLTFHDGGLAVPMAAGGIPGTPLDPVAQMVPPGTHRIVGDRKDVPEAYIPMDGSARSRQILAETNRLMGGNQQPIQVAVYLDTRQIAEALYDYEGTIAP